MQGKFPPTFQPLCPLRTLSVALTLSRYVWFFDGECNVVGSEAMSQLNPYFLTISLISL